MLDTLSWVQIAATAAIVFGAFVVRGTSGFGAGMVAIPLLVFALPIRTAVPLMSLLVFVLFLILFIRDRRDVVWDELKRLIPVTLAGVAAGALLFKHLDSALLVKLLGLVIVTYALYVLAVHFVGMPALRCSAKWAYPLGFVGGVVDTMFGGGGGTLVVVYMHLRGIGKAQFRATVAVLWFFEMIARIGGYAVLGFYTPQTLLLVLLLLPVMWVGTRAGEGISNRISQETFSRVLAVMLLVAGCSVLLK